MSPPRTARSTTSRPTPRAGETTQENGRLLCGFHNRLRNQKEHPPERQRPQSSANGHRRAPPDGAAQATGSSARIAPAPGSTPADPRPAL